MNIHKSRNLKHENYNKPILGPAERLKPAKRLPRSGTNADRLYRALTDEPSYYADIWQRGGFKSDPFGRDGLRRLAIGDFIKTSSDDSKKELFSRLEDSYTIEGELKKDQHYNFISNISSNKDSCKGIAVENDIVINGDEIIYEGASKEKVRKFYERNPGARKKCLAHWGFNCRICDFSFDEYGKIGKNYIHVHHIVPISDYNEEHTIDPVNDLCPVCPNCHAMLHRKHPPYTIAEIKQKLYGKN